MGLLSAIHSIGRRTLAKRILLGVLLATGGIIPTSIFLVHNHRKHRPRHVSLSIFDTPRLKESAVA